MWVERARCQPFERRIEEAMQRDLAPYRASNQFRHLSAEESYLNAAEGFDPQAMYVAIEQILRRAEQDRFPRVRTCGDMNWAVNLPHIDSLMEYEARVNLLTSGHDCTFMCVYDLHRFSGRTVMDVLSTHPMVLMGNRIYENPYYIEPQDFIRSLARRGSGRLARSDG